MGERRLRLELLEDADFVNAVRAADEARRTGRLDEFVR